MRGRLFAKNYIDTWFLLIMTVALLVAFRIVQPDWLNGHTVQNLVIQNAPLALVAMAMTFSIISRHIDLSPGSMIALSGAVIGLVYTAQGSMALAIAAGLGTALGAGLLNGFFVAGLGLNAVMVTLAAFIWARGLVGRRERRQPDRRRQRARERGQRELARLHADGARRGRRLRRRLAAAGAHEDGAVHLRHGRRSDCGTSCRNQHGALYRAHLPADGWDDRRLRRDHRGTARLCAGHGGARARTRRDHRRRHRRHAPRRRRGKRRPHRTGSRLPQHPEQRPAEPRADGSYFQLYRGLALLAVLSVQIVVRRATDAEERRKREQEQLSAALATA